MMMMNDCIVNSLNWTLVWLASGGTRNSAFVFFYVGTQNSAFVYFYVGWLVGWLVGYLMISLAMTCTQGGSIIRMMGSCNGVLTPSRFCAEMQAQL